MIDSSQTANVILREEHGQVAPTPRVHYIQYPFTVPEGATRVSVRLRYHKQRLCQLFLSMFDPDGFRGCHMHPAGQGDIDLLLWVAPDDASRGGIPGILPAGTWQAQIDVERTAEVADYTLTIEAEWGPERAPLHIDYPEHYVSRAEAGWYRGELHAHSYESDGKTPVADVVTAARRLGLDFLSLTDHFTTSGYRHLAALHSPELALIRGLELTGHAGHANFHGLQRWHDVFVDGRDDWDITQVAREVRAANGLVCVNHPFAADLGWRYHDLNWELVDMLEVDHTFEGPGNLLALGLWDDLLRRGYRIRGVAATDSHDPYAGRHRLGEITTAIYADELSERGLLDGIRRGRVYGTRGPHLELRATSDENRAHTAMMGDGVQPGRIEIEVELSRLDGPWRLHILKNGMPFDIVEQVRDVAREQAIVIEDHATSGTYYRVELHSALPSGDVRSPRWRDWSTLLAWSNPIFVD